MSRHNHDMKRSSIIYPADQQFYGIAASRHEEGLRGLHAVQSAYGTKKTGFKKVP